MKHYWLPAYYIFWATNWQHLFKYQRKTSTKYKKNFKDVSEIKNHWSSPVVLFNTGLVSLNRTGQINSSLELDHSFRRVLLFCVRGWKGSAGLAAGSQWQAQKPWQNQCKSVTKKQQKGGREECRKIPYKPRNMRGGDFAARWLYINYKHSITLSILIVTSFAISFSSWFWMANCEP